jgi:putative phosphoribosyl transferase
MFNNREEAGNLLALTRGGVVVGKIISEVLKLPFDIMVVKKIGSPSNPELAIGAVGPKGTVYWNEDLILKLRITAKDKKNLKGIKDRERKEHEMILRGQKKFDYKLRNIILVDDGIATGASTLVAQKFLKKEGADCIILAVPVISIDTLRDVKKYFDMVIALKSEKDFMAVGEFYKDFPQITNKEVVQLIN